MIEQLPISGVKLIPLKRLTDTRGWFSETFRQTWIDEHKIPNDFIFEFWSHNIKKGTLRGLHSQANHMVPGKLVQVLTGSIQDVIVDARQSSDTYGQHISITISATEPKLIYIPRGCYHGFVTLEDNTLVGYKVDQYHSAEQECGVAWNDTALSIDWAVKDNLIISNRDHNNPPWEHAIKF
jgi:dTDP-4-dehydrorhamnose 3,5-epimerase